MQQDLDEMNREAMLTEDKAKRAMMDAAKLAEDLRMEQDDTTRAEAERKMMEAQVKDLQVKLKLMIFIFIFARSPISFVVGQRNSQRRLSILFPLLLMPPPPPLLA